MDYLTSRNVLYTNKEQQKREKNKIRDIEKNKRSLYNFGLLDTLNNKIMKNFKILFNYLEASNKHKKNTKQQKIKVFIYLSSLKKIEPDTWEIIKYLQEKSDIYSIYVPKIVDREIFPVKYKNCFKENKYGIMECCDGSDDVKYSDNIAYHDNDLELCDNEVELCDNEAELCDNEAEYDEKYKNCFNINCDVVITPLLAFSKEGDRIGYGGGYYDRFLYEHTLHHGVSPIKIGLSFHNHSDCVWEPEVHDVKLDYVVSATKVYEF